MSLDRRFFIAQLGAASAFAPLAATAEPERYTYDALGRLIQVTFSDGSIVQYGYDAAGNRTTVVRSGTPIFTSTVPILGMGPVNLRTLADSAGYNGAQSASITFTLANGVTISGAAGAPIGGIGIDTGDWPVASYNISLVLSISGAVRGGGGRGGRGGGSAYSTTGSAGGDAIACRVPIAVTVNAGGVVQAGGGGGGGGGAWRAGTLGEYQYYNGGGGGGGFPNGPGGDQGVADNDVSNNGASGTGAAGGAGGAGGNGSLGAGGNGSTGAGGAGAGVNGTGAAGAASTGSTNSEWVKIPPALGGGPGYAIRKNGHAVTVTNNGTITGTVG